jgi:plasmid stability protein
MSQLLVRGIEESLVRKLKRRASAHGVSVEEEHRLILREALIRPAKGKPSLIEFLLSDDAAVHPGVEIEIPRSRKLETHRESKF